MVWPDTTYDISFDTYSSEDIIRRSKFRALKINRRFERQYKLCRECSFYLVKEKKLTIASQNKYTWPSFIWTVLNNEKVTKIYGNKVWQFVPLQWMVD